MKIEHESIFVHSLRAFFVTFFGILGAIMGTLILTLAVVAVIYLKDDEEGFGSGIKLLADTEGHRKELSSSAPVILQIDLRGEIGKDELTGKKISNLLLKSREDKLKDNRVKGILLVIDSPGGGVNDSDVIYRHLKEYKKLYSVPIYVFVDGICASGGYYIACASDKIYASDVSLVGSIGVLAWPPFLNVADTLEKLGVSSVTLFAGTGKDQLNPTRTWEPEEQKTYQKIIDYYYSRFVSIVSQDRPKIPREKLVKDIGARIFPAPQALELGFIDANGATRNEALKELAEAAGIKEKYQVISFESKSWWEKLFKNNSPLVTGRIKHEFHLPWDGNDPFSYVYYR